ncbi:glycoside hydrolase family 3 N-terminal domain-containing protein [Asticcacaulis sp. BYS171W]|uniref:beta-glucosidase n=1 Tax=Asticcacaulis aquaticus TaxID=2984212 RepID=A0ABT5HVT0_9CAUL|nr:glycoside hydrolase family 3 N-terminal domain-containing protein [Asticcacaulis aquaticus]MDC7684180.1 glycoside hydrolase family 3 N-terminal domain-containing protein [Asticcacaulis aquaticus]
MTGQYPTRRHVIAGVSTAALTVAASRATAAALPYKNAALPVEQRVADLLGWMTLEEKVAQMQCVWLHKDRIQTAGGDFDASQASQAYPNGLGMIARPSDRKGVKNTNAGADAGMANRNAFETATYTNAAQKWAVEQTRLGIPLFLHEESLHGYTARDATCFPQAIALASSFDPALVERVFSVCAKEMRARGANLALAPVVDVCRDPRWGRVEETYGEDTHLMGVMGKAAVTGFSGTERKLAKDKVFATLKHMTGHGQPERGINTAPAQISERVLREVFFPPFEKIVKETPIAAVMPSYNEIDGIPSHANKWLLTTILRKEWGFKGVTVSDYFALKEMQTRHRLVPDLTEAAYRAVKAGVDIETPDGEAYPNLIALVKAGRVTEAEIDAIVRRILELKFLGGLFEAPYVDANAADGLTATPDAVKLAREAAVRSAVLLKNDGVLPLDGKKVGKLLLLGTHAKDTPIGGYSDIPRHVVSIHEGLEKEAKAQGFILDYREAVRLTKVRDWAEDKVEFTDPAVNAKLIAEAVEAAKSADTIVMVLGDNEQTSREAWWETHLGDRDSLDLIGQQNDLAAAIFALNKPTVVFLLNGRPLSINLLQDKANAIIEGWYLGQETGHAAADLLFGHANPGGKLPISIPRSVGQLPVFYNAKPTANRNYLGGDNTPLYPFGFGLSYTSFALSAPRLSKATIKATDSVTVSVELTNTGKVAGDEVVQLYIRDDVSSVTRPIKELKGFRRVTLTPGAQTMVELTITPADLQFYDTDMKRVVEPGTFTIMTGANSVDLKTVTLTVA